MGYNNQKGEASALIIEHYGSGTATLNSCNFKYNVANANGYKTIGAALTIQFNSADVEYAAVELTNCVFDTNIGESCGAISIKGVSNALSQLSITSCSFMNNVAYSYSNYPDLLYANDIFFDMSNIQSIL
jgi:hypothetical protein